ncbi:serine hydrolase [Thioalkalivibrio sp. XN8]|uniref:serine hydrolase n=1 Tax=Thioalkalivibrio sp. XN8 TaxID=2712863 RepID=UPI0013EB7C39|nr:serine hydrolase [Thioalkalivibrio sp. XN8]NGP53208.1 serine hydrolase [Thioalkalivibrio sp. XN8]
MRTLQPAAIGSLLLNFLLASPASASSEYAQWLEDAWPAEGPGAAAMVVRNGDVLFRSASGMADMELGVALTPDHVFRIGSISKQFTAAAILLLEEQGKLSVTDDIRKFLPDYPTHGHEIRLEHLLTHTSGISNYTSIPGYWEGGAIRKDVSTAELIAVFSGLPMDFAPGEAFRYSNSGYVLLGAIIEKVSGMSYADFMQTAIFDTLALNKTCHGGLQIIPGRAKGYQGEAGEYQNADFISMTQPHGAGALLSTVDDLARWSAALFGGALLSQESLEKMTTDFQLNNGERIGYGFGLTVGERFGEREITHDGGIHGFSTSGIWLPERKIYAVVLSNNQDSRATSYVAARMAFDAAGADYPRFTAVEVDPARLADYQGVYRIGDEDSRSVVLEEGRLYTQRTGGPRLRIAAAGGDRFFYLESFSYLDFVRDSSGRVVAMEMHHGGAPEAERAERISDEVPVE